jgi:hypothetical protein
MFLLPQFRKDLEYVYQCIHGESAYFDKVDIKIHRVQGSRKMRMSPRPNWIAVLPTQTDSQTLFQEVPLK